jgi:hypothetical protein
MEMAELRTTTGGGTQNATGTPQTAGGGSFGAGQQASTVQPGTPRDSLNSQGGIPLDGSRITPISLDTRSTSTTTPVAQPTPKQTSPLATAFSVLLILVAIVVVISIIRPVKNTTE